MKKLIVLGTGTAIVTKYFNTCFIVDNGKEYFLVDGGGGGEILKRFEILGLEWNKLRYAFLSHGHTDHILGMIWVIRMIAHNMRIGIYTENFTLYCHENLAENVRTICGFTLQPIELDFLGKRIHIIPIKDAEQKSFLDYKIVFFDILSTKMKQYGFHMNYENDKSLVFLGDEPLSESGHKYCENADWLLAEAFCLYNQREIYTPYKYHHSTVKEAAENAEAYHVKNLILWHTEDGTFNDRKALYTKEANQYYRGNTFVPEDGDIIQI